MTDFIKHTLFSLSRLPVIGLLAITSACGGGGGGSDDSDAPTGVGERYSVQAQVTRDSCGERLSDVRQSFTIDGNVLDTSLVKFSLESVDGTLRGGFTETNGDCTREYEAILAEPDGQATSVTLLSRSLCSTVQCETEWVGTLTPITEDSRDADFESFDRVRGENCNPNVPSDVGFRPSLFECNGNAAVLLRGNQRNNYSVVVRRNGQFNDRDPRNPSCETNRCSPYKTQKRLELPEYQVNCLGDDGFSGDYVPVERISIKYTAQIANPNDTSQFEQYCLNDTTASFN